MASAGSKRARSAWEDCDDVSELKQMLSKQQDQIDKLTKEKTELRKTLKAAEGQPADQSDEDLNAKAGKLLSSLYSNISAQMVYRNKHSSSRVSADVPNVSLPQASPQHLQRCLSLNLCTPTLCHVPLESTPTRAVACKAMHS